MNILFLTPELPYPGTDGGTIKSKCLLDHLCAKHSVTLVSLLKRHNHASFDEFVDKYKTKLKNAYYFKVDKNRNIVNFIISIIKNVPLIIYRYADKTVGKEIKHIINGNNFDVIFCDHMLMAQYIPKISLRMTILHKQNADYIMWRRYADTENRALMRFMARYEAHRMLSYESKICDSMPMIMAAPSDIELLKPYINIKHTRFAVTYHLSFDDALKYPAVQNTNSHRLLFVGSMTWDANIKAVRWFIDNVYGQIKKNNPLVSLWVAGKYKTLPIQTTDESIHLLGFVDDLDELFQNSAVFICPLQYGSGMKLKVFDAMYRGLPIVTTSIGAESIDLADGENCFIADDADDFANKTGILLNDAAIWDKFSKNSRALADKKYRWEDEYERVESCLAAVRSGSDT